MKGHFYVETFDRIYSKIQKAISYLQLKNRISKCWLILPIRQRWSLYSLEQSSFLALLLLTSLFLFICYIMQRYNMQHTNSMNRSSVIEL